MPRAQPAARFLLRIEDIDTTRCRPEFETAIFEDLGWLGLTWDKTVRRQSDHLADYATSLDRLRELGVLYRCFLTRREIAEHSASAPHGAGEGPDGICVQGSRASDERRRGRDAHRARRCRTRGDCR